MPETPLAYQRVKPHRRDFHYTMILDISPMWALFDIEFENIKEEHLLMNDHHEDLYEWMVLESLQNKYLLPVKQTLFNHYKHDFYEVVYEYMKEEFEAFIGKEKSLIDTNFKKYQRVRAMVSGPNLIVDLQGRM